MNVKVQPAAKVSRMSIKPWSRKGRKRMDFSHLDMFISIERNCILCLVVFISNMYCSFSFLSGLHSAGKKVFSIHLTARSSAAASSAMRAEYPPAASRNGRTTLEGCLLVGRTRYKVLHRSDGEYRDKLSSLPSSDPLQNHFKDNCCRL